MLTSMIAYCQALDDNDEAHTIGFCLSAMLVHSKILKCSHWRGRGVLHNFISLNTEFSQSQ